MNRKRKLSLVLALALVMSLLLGSISAAAETSELNNSIATTYRTVYQNGTALGDLVAGNSDLGSKDIYTVTGKQNITVKYSNSMDMTKLDIGESTDFRTLLNQLLKVNNLTHSFDVNENSTPWEVLQACREYITNDTYIWLSYKMDDSVLVSEVDLSTLASQITLTSDMFTFSQTANDLEIEDNTLSIRCYWNGTNANNAVSSNGSLDPTITLTGVELPVTSNWGTDDSGESNDTLTINAVGSVYGLMSYSISFDSPWIPSTNPINGTATINGGTATDIFQLVMEKTNVTLSAVWDDADNYDGLRPDSVDVTLYKTYTDSSGSEVTEAVGTYTLSSDNGYTVTVSDLPAYDDYGNAITYSAAQASVSGYTTTDTGMTGSIDDGYAITFTNQHIPVTSVSVQKVWDDSDDAAGLRPSSVTIELLQNGVATGETLVLSEENDWTGTFTDLTRFEDNDADTPYTYSVSEEAVTGYTVSITGGATDDDNYAYTVTNTHITAVDTGDSGRAFWVVLMGIAGSILLIGTCVVRRRHI